MEVKGFTLMLHILPDRVLHGPAPPVCFQNLGYETPGQTLK